MNATLADTQGVGTIRDNDRPPTVSINDVRVDEGNRGTIAAVFTVTLSGPSGLPIEVRYDTVSGTATANVDYQTSGATLTFCSG